MFDGLELIEFGVVDMTVKKAVSADSDKNCFVIMPIADMPPYPNDHFTHVYKDIIVPAVEAAGYKPIRADESKTTNIIHADIIKKIVECPLAICDVSGRNPNVLFELGIRQAFDKPVVIIKDNETADIFDIATIRYITYSRHLGYRDVLNTQSEITKFIHSTMNPDTADANINSIIKFIQIASPAKISPMSVDNKQNFTNEILLRELDSIKITLSKLLNDKKRGIFTPPPTYDDHSISDISIENLDIEVSKIQKKLFAGITTKSMIDSVMFDIQRLKREIILKLTRANDADQRRRLDQLLSMLIDSEKYIDKPLSN
ncbi:hypothetical protein [Acetobacter sp. DsW_063]|uniref:hypothetical protein n=1 Tax=Acetobacter sp. DsW_063 TaxID=1514894 RepID=UPI000A3A93D8|nr:hypothetical protein [Acetobacter sp. DsW_063]